MNFVALRMLTGDRDFGAALQQTCRPARGGLDRFHRRQPSIDQQLALAMQTTLRLNGCLIVPDLRGYGQSTLPVGRETTLETFASDGLAVMDALGIRTFALGSLSMGGQIALEMYRQATDRIERLLLADTFAGLDSPERRQLRLATADRLEHEGMHACAREEVTKMIAPANAEQFPNIAAHVMEMMTTTPPRGAAAALRGRARRRDYLPLLKDIRVPTVVVVGREDVYTPVPLAESFATTFRARRST